MYTYHWQRSFIDIFSKITTNLSKASNYIRCSRLKIGCLSVITKRRTCSSMFNVQRNDVQVGLISNFTIQFLDPTRFDVCLIEAKINVSVFDFTYLGKWTCSSSLLFEKWHLCSMKWCPITYDLKIINSNLIMPILGVKRNLSLPNLLDLYWFCKRKLVMFKIWLLTQLYKAIP